MEKSNTKNDRYSNIDISEYGKIPPQEISFEESILGALLKWPEDTEYLDKCLRFLRPEVFYKISHQIIFSAILELYNSNIAYDSCTVSNHLRKREDNDIDAVGGEYYISLLSMKATSMINLEFQSAFIFECYIRRELIRLLTENINLLYDYKNDIVDIYESLHNEIERIFEFVSDEVSHTIDSIVDRTLKEIENVSNGVSNSIIKFNDILFDKLYVMPYDIISIASPRAAGKTRYLIKIMKGLFEKNKDCAAMWYSMEDSDTKISRLWASIDTGISESDMMGKGNTISKEDFQRVSKSMTKFKKYDCSIINDQETIASIARKFNSFTKKRAEKTCFLIIDNIMLIEDIYNNMSNNQTQVEDMVAGSIRKIINKNKRNNIKVVIIFLHHMTKEMESRSNLEEAYRPRLSHMKGSTRLADICTIIALINNMSMHKDIIKKQAEFPDIQCMNSVGEIKYYKRAEILKNLLIIEIAKNRDGEVSDDSMICRYITDMNKMKFSELKVIK